MELRARTLLLGELLLAALVLAVHGDLCEVNFCANGGTCVTSGSEVFCICPEEFTGDNCTERETGPCSPNPCLNDGECEVVSEKRRGDVFSQYRCVCPPETTGVHCETRVPGSHLSSTQDINECQKNPCQNEGQCSNLNGDFACTCPSPYVGKRCHLRCISRLGLEGGGIAESQVRSSSVRYTLMGLQRWGPELARLNLKGLVNAWSPAPHDRYPWIQVDLTRIMRISGLVSQGAGRLGYSEFVKAFKVSYSLNGTDFTYYQRDGKDLVFSGNMDKDSPKTTLLDPPLVAQFIRIVPVVCRRACTLRLEIIGCELNGCSEQMGMRSRLISDSQISASSSFRTWGLDSFTWRPEYARLDKQGKTNAWTAAVNDQNQWIQVDLGSSKKLTGIITQGAKDFGHIQFVTAFKVSCSNNGQDWSTVQDHKGQDKIFPGNTDNNVHKTNRFDPPLFCRFVRVLPWDWHGRITLRMELLGCSQ
ncbi:lactadherin-like isoform X2 [Boleophthalmus pectinirostris]|uniref:lactadherin-like isoform X2 n=1 Tax=Boleophthalmus pectinirostris TaxID=150288 RepID=UPI000A1C310D|nr:lactadherin-like isoform X2 [Boleophthalmus pectinirostris]